jgi:PIN domain nuclease of toxin-antitoxin system
MAKGGVAAVTDTHPLIYYANRGRGLSPRAASFFTSCERQEAVLYVPAAVVWECTLLARSARVNLRRTPRAFFDDLFSNPAFYPFDLTLDQIFVADESRIGRDTFDNLICAAARSLDLPLITRDANIQESGAVRVLW